MRRLWHDRSLPVPKADKENAQKDQTEAGEVARRKPLVEKNAGPYQGPDVAERDQGIEHAELAVLDSEHVQDGRSQKEGHADREFPVEKQVAQAPVELPGAGLAEARPGGADKRGGQNQQHRFDGRLHLWASFPSTAAPVTMMTM